MNSSRIRKCSHTVLQRNSNTRYQLNMQCMRLLLRLLYLVVEHRQSVAEAEEHNQVHNLVDMDWALLGMTAEAAGDNSRLDHLEGDSIDLAEAEHRRNNLCWT